MESPHTARAGPLLLQDFLLIDLIYKFDRERIPKRVAKIKRGLPGFINGSRTDALADTGAAQNVVSADFAREKGLVIEGKAALFRLGNSKRVRSAGKFKQAV